MVLILTLTLVASELVWTRARVSTSDGAISDARAVAMAIMITTGVENWKKRFTCIYFVIKLILHNSLVYTNYYKVVLGVSYPNFY